MQRVKRGEKKKRKKSLKSLLRKKRMNFVLSVAAVVMMQMRRVNDSQKSANDDANVYKVERLNFFKRYFLLTAI